MNIYKLAEERIVDVLYWLMEKWAMVLGFVEQIKMAAIGFAILFVVLYGVGYFISSDEFRDKPFPWEKEEKREKKKREKALKKKKWFEY